MKLVIVESPAKAKTINKYLGKDYHVTSSYGHIRDLPSKNGSVEPDKNFIMHYEINPKASRHVKVIIDLAKKAEKIYLATDPDREGEAIAWHVVEVLKNKKALKAKTEVKRIVFHEITKNAVLDAVANPRDISMDLVNAQQARRALDYLVGFTLSPVLWRKLPGSKSAGRVQSVALRLICEREDEIERFIIQEYWSIKCLLNNNKDDFFATLVSIKGEKLEKLALATQKSVEPIVEHLAKAKYAVVSVEKKQQKRHPYPPFITSTLQQEAARKLGFSAKKTMMIAQKLYEEGLITYMRTDGVQLSQDSVKETRDYINKNFGANYLPQSPITYKTKVKNAQEAHEAIRPTSVMSTPNSLKQSDKDHSALYQLIWKRTVACQMSSAILDQVQALIETQDKYAQLKATGSTIAFDGFYKVYKEGSDHDDEEKEYTLPPLKEGEDLNLKDVIPDQHFTEPPPRYSEASLVKKLEELGIGRPSTYASIISVLQEREYVKLDKKRFIPEDRGRLVTAFLTSLFKRYVEYDFTAQLEDKLDLVSDHQLEWKSLLAEFWKDFSKNTTEISQYPIEQVTSAMLPLIENYVFPKHEDGTDRRSCPECKKGVLDIRMGKFGPFVACNNYPECKHTRHLHAHSKEEEKLDNAWHEDKILGVDEESGFEVALKKGPFGLYLQLGEKGNKLMKRATIPAGFNPESLDLKTALLLLSLPRTIGINPKTGEEVKAGIGRFGPYLLHNKKYTSLSSVEEVFGINLDAAIKIMESSTSGGKALGEYQGKPISVHKGRFGPYLKFGKDNVKIPKGTNANEIDLEKAKEIISSKS